jgi:hypothetical protein
MSSENADITPVHPQYAPSFGPPKKRKFHHDYFEGEKKCSVHFHMSKVHDDSNKENEPPELIDL